MKKTCLVFLIRSDKTNDKNVLPMNNLETSQHLFQKPKYSLGDGKWSESFLEIAGSSTSLSWDPAAFLSFVTFGYVCGDHTLVKEVRRQPWLSDIEPSGAVRLGSVPDHGFLKRSPEMVANELLVRLEDEAEQACQGFSDVFVLLSGGLDSRIVAGVVKRLLDKERIKANVHAISWGQNGSRDVNIGKHVAEKLGFSWTHLELTQEHLNQNVTHSAYELGALISPVHLHRMMWFRDFDHGNGIVLAGSYGDSVGRAEFSGRTVLELLPFRFQNQHGLLRASVVSDGKEAIAVDMREYRERIGNRPEYGARECEHQAHYMRGMIAQTMSVIDSPNACRLYQMFSAPEVFNYVWSIHPSFRTNEPYARILSVLGGGLDEIPWARTNRPLKGKSRIRIKSTVNQYHNYPQWLCAIVDGVDVHDHSDWLESTGLFQPSAVLDLFRELKATQSSGIKQSATGVLAWTLAFRKMADAIQPLAPPPYQSDLSDVGLGEVKLHEVSSIRRYFREIPAVLSTVRRFRKWVKNREAIQKYPPQE